jgi:hypothetical protein
LREEDLAVSSARTSFKKAFVESSTSSSMGVVADAEVYAFVAGGTEKGARDAGNTGNGTDREIEEGAGSPFSSPPAGQ